MPAKIRKRGENSYQLFVPGGYDSNGKQQGFHKTVTADNITEAKKLYDLFLSECLQGKVLTAGTEKITLDEFYQYWGKHHAEKHLELTTQSHNDYLFTRVNTALGHLRIDKIQPKHILEFIDQLSEPTAAQGDEPFSPNTIRQHFTLLNVLLSAAVKWKLIINNPCDDVTKPKRAKTYKKILNETELSTFFNKLDKYDVTKHQLWILLAFTLGLRREEIFGLKWQNINFNENTISIERAIVYVRNKGLIEKDTKTDSSYRKLSAPGDVMYLLLKWRDDVMSAYKRRCKRNKVAMLDNPIALDKWVFTKSDGSVGHPHAFNCFIRQFCKNNGLSKISPHLLRHMSGSYLLKGGIDIASVSAKLGHADKSFTMKTYIHSLESTEKQTANVMQNILNDLKTPQNKKGQAN